MEALKIGPFIIQEKLILIIVAAIITYFVLQYIFINNKEFKIKIVDNAINSVIIMVIAYKLSIIIFSPAIFFSKPSNILYYNGGKKGIIFGLIIALVYYFSKAYREKWSKNDTFNSLVYIVISFLTSYWLLRTILFIFLK